MVTPHASTWGKVAHLYALPMLAGSRVCSTCASNLRRGALPTLHKLCQTHGLRPVPQVLVNLLETEERLISMRIPFAQLVKLRIHRQAGLKGSVVNVPTNLNKISTLLPRTDI